MKFKRHDDGVEITVSKCEDGTLLSCQVAGYVVTVTPLGLINLMLNGRWIPQLEEVKPPEREFPKTSLSDRELNFLWSDDGSGHSLTNMGIKYARQIADAAIKQHILDQETQQKMTPKEMFEKYGLSVKIPAPSSYYVRKGLPGAYWDNLPPIPTQDYGL